MGSERRREPASDPPPLFTERQWRQLARQLELTPRQVAVAQLICAECQISDMARRMHVSPNTVGSHLKTLYVRLGVRSRVGVVIRLVLAARKLEA